jgi:hypothetical protein
MLLDSGGNLRVAGGLATAANVTVASGGDGYVWTRHVRGKNWASDTDDNLHLNWDSGRDVFVGNPGGNAANLHVAGNLLVHGDDDSAFRVRTYPMARKNADPPWTVNVAPDFTKVFTAFVVLQGFSIWDNSGDLAFGNFNHLADNGAIVQHCFVRITSVNNGAVQGDTFCQESAMFEDDNTVLFTVVVFGRKR